MRTNDLLAAGACLLLAGAGPFRLQAEEAPALTLPAAIAGALTNNPALRAARERIRAADGRAGQAQRWPNPELELSSEEFPPGGGGLSAAKNYVGASQALPYPGKKKLDAEIGRQGVAVAAWEYTSREIELVRAVKTAFAATLAAERKVAVAAQRVELARSLAAAARTRLAAGAGTEQERLRAEIECDRATVEASAVHREQAEDRRTLAALMGRAGEALGPLQGELRERAEWPALAEARERLLARHPHLRAAAAGRERAELLRRRAGIEPLPDITVGVAGGRDAEADRTLLALRLTVPLPLFDRAQGRQREAQAEAEIAKYDLTAAEQALFRELSEADDRLHAADEQAEAYRTRILPRSEEALRLVRAGFEAGKTGFLDLADTQRTLAESQLAYCEKLSELNAAQASLEALLLQDRRAPPPAGEPAREPPTRE